jgi:UDP-N-acetyl-D-glucosamine dehydrogenase
LLECAEQINSRMPSYVISKDADALNDVGKAVRGSKIAILGMTDKKNLGDPCESPSFELMDLLLKKGARVSYNDPHISSLGSTRHRLHLESAQSQAVTAGYLTDQDCVLIAADHSIYDYAFIVRYSRLVIDTRHATKNVINGCEKIIRI